MDSTSVPPKPFRWRYIAYIFVAIFIVPYIFIWVRPSIVFFTQSDTISFSCFQDMRSRFWLYNDNPFSGAYIGLFVRKVEVLDNEAVRLYGWFNNVLWEERLGMGGENDCRVYKR